MFEIHPEFRTPDSKEERQHLIWWLVRIAIFAFALVAILAYSIKARSEEIPVVVFEQQHVKLRLMPGPCADRTSLMLIMQTPDKYHHRWKSIQSDWRIQDGSWKAYGGCWLELTKEEAQAPDSVIVMVFEDGATATVLKSDLLKKPNA